MNDKIILKLKSNWDKIKIIATITFIILAGTVYSVSTMIKGGKAHPGPNFPVGHPS